MLHIGPHRYQSASGALQNLGESLEALGERAFVIANKTALERFEDVVRESLGDSMIGVHFEVSLGQCCQSEVERLADEASKDDADMIVGIGAGKTLDIAKLTSEKLDCKLITVPSIASSYAAFSNLAYLYSGDGEFLKIKELETTPDLTIVDYKVVGLASSRHLRAGIGVALAASYDFDLSHGELELHQPSEIAFSLAQHLRESLFADGEKALEDVKKGEVTSNVEAVVEMNILEAGLVSSLGGKTFRSMVAHHLARELYSYTDDEVLYGDVVAFSLIVQQLFVGRKVGDLEELLKFYRKVELPLTFSSLELPENQRETILEDALESVLEYLENWSFSFELTKERLLNAVEEANDVGETVIQSGFEGVE